MDSTPFGLTQLLMEDDVYPGLVNRGMIELSWNNRNWALMIVDNAGTAQLVLPGHDERGDLILNVDQLIATLQRARARAWGRVQ